MTKLKITNFTIASYKLSSAFMPFMPFFKVKGIVISKVLCYDVFDQIIHSKTTPSKHLD